MTHAVLPIQSIFRMVKKISWEKQPWNKNTRHMTKITERPGFAILRVFHNFYAVFLSFQHFKICGFVVSKCVVSTRVNQITLKKRTPLSTMSRQTAGTAIHILEELPTPRPLADPMLGTRYIATPTDYNV